MFCSLYLNNKIYQIYKKLNSYNSYNKRRHYVFSLIAMFFFNSKNQSYNTPYFYKSQHPMNEFCAYLCFTIRVFQFSISLKYRSKKCVRNFMQFTQSYGLINIYCLAPLNILSVSPKNVGLTKTEIYPFSVIRIIQSYFDSHCIC